MNPIIKAFLRALREKAGAGDHRARLLLAGVGHPYDCRCAICLKWWATMGDRGPFTEAEIKGHVPLHS